MQTSADTRHGDAAGSCIEPPPLTSITYQNRLEVLSVYATVYTAALCRPILLTLHRSLQARLVLFFKEVTLSCET